MFKSEQEKYPVYNGRPANRRGPPIAIYHRAFAQLKDALQDLNKVVDPQEVKRVDDTAKLFLASTQIYKTEKDRTDNIYPYIRSLLGIELRENVVVATGGRKKAESDALVEQGLDDKTFGETVGIVSHLEAKNELGVAGQCGVQNALGLRKSLVNDKVRHPHNYAVERNGIRSFTVQEYTQYNLLSLHHYIHRWSIHCLRRSNLRRYLRRRGIYGFHLPRRDQEANRDPFPDFCRCCACH